MTAEQTLTIGIDIDGTVTDPGCFVPALNESFGKNLCLADCTTYDLNQVYGISEETFVRWLDEHSERIYRTADVHGEAARILRKWHRRHRLVYISAREERHREATREWFIRHEIPWDEIDLVGSHDKLAQARARSVDIFLEDRLENALQLAEGLSIPVLLFDTPYNQGVLPSLVRRVHHWEEADDVLHEWFSAVLRAREPR